MVIFKEIYLLNSIHFIYFLIFISIFFLIYFLISIYHILVMKESNHWTLQNIITSIEFYSVHPDLYPFVNS